MIPLHMCGESVHVDAGGFYRVECNAGVESAFKKHCE